MVPKEIKAASDEHQNILAAVQELRKEHVALIDNNKTLKVEFEDFKKQFEITKAAANKQIQECLQEAKEKSGKAENILQENKKRESELNGWAESLSAANTSLINGQISLAEKEKAFYAEIAEKESTLAAREENFKQEVTAPLGRLVIENDRIEKLAESLKTIEERNQESKEILSRMADLKLEIEGKEKQLAEGTKKLAVNVDNLELRRREIEALDKRVQQIIKVKGLEEEVKSYVG